MTPDMQQPRMIGIVTTAVSKALGEEGRFYKAGDMIYIGDSNINHIKRRHSSAYARFAACCHRLSQSRIMCVLMVKTDL